MTGDSDWQVDVRLAAKDEEFEIRVTAMQREMGLQVSCAALGGCSTLMIHAHA